MSLIELIEGQNSVDRPEKNAAPRAVVSVIFGLITFVFSKSAYICISKLFLLAPPSTFRE